MLQDNFILSENHDLIKYVRNKQVELQLTADPRRFSTGMPNQNIAS